RQALTLMDRALKGETDAQGMPLVDRLPPELQPVIKTMRRHIDALSRRLIRSGALSSELVPVVSGNEGFYVTRTYRVHDDPKWAESVPEDVRNKAKALLTTKYPGRTPEQI